MFYLFHRFIKETRNDIVPDLSFQITQSVQDLLAIEVHIPKPDDVVTDVLAESVRDSAFDGQLYLYETVGILCSLLWKDPEQQAALLLSIVKPLMDELSASLDAYRKANDDISSIVKTRHIIMALGNISKGFPDYPSPAPPGYEFSLRVVFAQISQAILVCLEAMNVYQVVRDAVSSSSKEDRTPSYYFGIRLALLSHES
jgi:exportin-T